jgi:sugar lactone lactonase YvrE
LELISDSVSFPTGITFDSEGMIYVAESRVPLDAQPPIGRILRIYHDNRRRILIDDLSAPVNGITFHNDGLYILENGHIASISAVRRNGEKTIVINGLP